jgi:hypothetical protein
MFIQLLIGTLLISLTVILQASFFYAAELALDRFGPKGGNQLKHIKSAFFVTGGTLWIMLAHSISVWMWAFAFLQIEVFTELEPALYFSVVSLTTLGFGDVLLPTEWRLLSGLCAANGLLIFGLSTAFLVEFLRGLGQANGRASRT